jgi:virginiamycin A acetyltransferase
MPFRSSLKSVVDAFSLVLAFPPALTCWAEARWNPTGEAVFGFWAQSLAVIPGHPGLFLRRAFYRLTLDRCAASFYVGFGALLTHRSVIVEEGAYVGPYSLIGSAHLGKQCFIGSRVSILSGTALHKLDEDGRWTPADLADRRQVRIGDHAWIGEGAIVMVDVGAGSLVGAGAVVSTRVRPGVVVAGNPATFLRRLRPDSEEGDVPPSRASTAGGRP